MRTVSLEVRPASPYDLAHTAEYLTYSRGRYVADAFEQGTYRRLLDLADRFAMASVRSEGSVESPLLAVEIEGDGLDPAVVPEARRQLERILGTENRLASFYSAAESDSLLAPVVRAFRGLHIPQAASVFEALILAILAQQISIQVAHTLRTRLVQTYGAASELHGTVYYAFPRPEELAATGRDALRALGFGAGKAECIVDIAERVARGDLDLERLRTRPSEEAVVTLTGIRGVGPWTAQWLLIRALGRRDGFPSEDLALRSFLGKLVNGGVRMSSREALDYSRRWSPHRSYVTTYLFAAARSGRLDALKPAQVGP